MRCQVIAIIAVFNNRDYKLTVDKFLKKDYKGNKTVLLQFLEREEYYFLLLLLYHYALPTYNP